MKLSKIVQAVNAKSFGETSWTYDEILPYFQQAISELNGELEAFRQLPVPDDVSESDTFYDIKTYTALPDTHILNYVVTYIVVAMDNAQLANTSRTQTYASQLNKYKEQLISDLYRWMPITANSNIYFDLDGRDHKTNIPNVGKVWYDEDAGGMLSANEDSSGKYQTLPITNVFAENPYGTLVPENTGQRVLLGDHYYNYIFIPYDDFRQYYNPVRVQVLIKGYNIPYRIVHNNGRLVMDIGCFGSDYQPLFTTQESLFKYMWSIMKGPNGKAITSMPTAMVGSYHLGNGYYKSFIFINYEEYLVAISEYKRYRIEDADGNYSTIEFLNNNEDVWFDNYKLYYHNGDTSDTPKMEVATLYNINDLQQQINTNETDIEGKLQALKNDLSSGTKDVVSNDTLDAYFPSSIIYEED